MLSIRFGLQREWWVSGKVFDRLFQSALDNGDMPLALEHWRDIADANGGFGFLGMDPDEVEQFKAALRRSAERELARLGDVDPISEDGTYRVSLLKLLNVISLRPLAM